MTNQIRHRPHRTDRSDPAVITALALPSTADASRGTTNLATVPRAGNISTDTRAGTHG